MIRTLISMEDNVYQFWQAQLLADTFHQARQPGVLTRLVSVSNSQPVRRIDGVETIITRAYSPDPRSGDSYPAYNKPGSICEWLDQDPGDDDETVMIIDPDFVFVGQMLLEPEHGRPLSEPISYMQWNLPDSQVVLNRHCRVAHDKVPAVGVPNLIRRGDLRTMAPRWYELTRQLRDDSVTRATLDWICEMWAYSIASAEVGLEHVCQPLGHFQHHTELRLPLIHYCYHSQSQDKSWRWTKREYVAWTKPAPCPLDTTIVEQRLAALVEAAAAKHGFKRVT